MFSVYPGTPAIRQLIPLITISTFTPLLEASISFLIITLSVSELHLNPMYPSLPSATFSISLSISSTILLCIHLGDTRRCSVSSTTCSKHILLKTSATSLAISSLAVINDKSV